MKTIILISLFLFLVWYLNKKSTNKHFYKSIFILKNELTLCITILKNFDFEKTYIDRFTKAYNFFIDKPLEYNGTSIINDRHTIKGLEIQSVVHDYDWIIATSLKDLHISNIRYAKALRKMNSNWIKTWIFVFVGLSIVSIFKSLKYIKFTKIWILKTICF